MTSLSLHSELLSKRLSALNHLRKNTTESTLLTQQSHLILHQHDLQHHQAYLPSAHAKRFDTSLDIEYQLQIIPPQALNRPHHHMVFSASLNVFSLPRVSTRIPHARLNPLACHPGSLLEQPMAQWLEGVSGSDRAVTWA